MKVVSLIVLSAFIGGCAVSPDKTTNASNAAKPQVAAVPCLGDTDLPKSLEGKFEAATDAELLKASLGEAGKGKLCQGKVYQAKADAVITIYRAWNSTNPYSEFGSWWAAGKPAGSVAQYRSDYEICYQWSPLDVLTQCELKAGTKLVVGTGQSAVCSEYLTYPVSATKQLYIENTKDVVANCTTAAGQFSW